MAAAKFDIKELERRMRGAMDTLKKEFAGLRTGRASVHLLDPVVVNVYGQRMPITQVATVSTPDARTISVQVWDKSQVSAVEKAIRESNLGLNPIIDGALMRLPIPALNAERRHDGGNASTVASATPCSPALAMMKGEGRQPRGTGSSMLGA